MTIYEEIYIIIGILPIRIMFAVLLPGYGASGF